MNARRLTGLLCIAASAACSGSGSSSSSGATSASTSAAAGSTSTSTTAHGSSGSSGSHGSASTATASSSSGHSSSSTGSAAATTGSSGSTGGSTASSSGSTGSNSSSSGAPADPCTGIANCTPFIAGTATEAQIDTALAMAGPGDTLAFSAGSFSFANSLTVTSSGVTLLGAGKALTTFDFSGQTAGADGIDALTGSNNLTMQGFEVLNAAGNAIKVLGSSNIVFEDLAAVWNNPNSLDHGPYGIYPVQCVNILIENCLIVGASDSGVYVGQTQNAVVRSNEAHDNVAGIEIENTFHADVYKNYSHDNTAGLLVFDLPNLQQQGGHDNRVFDNQVVNNNTENFAVNGDIVGIVPAGTGMFVMANHHDEVFGNTVTGNETVAIGVISYYLSQLPITDPNYYPFPYDDSVHDNYVDGNGEAPDQNPAQPLGLLLASALGVGAFPSGHVVDLAYDGILDPSFALDAGVAFLPDAGLPRGLNVMDICFHNNGGDAGAATFGDLNATLLDVYLEFPDGGLNPNYDGGAASNLGQILTLDDGGAFDCTQTPVAGVVIDGGLLPDGGP